MAVAQEEEQKLRGRWCGWCLSGAGCRMVEAPVEGRSVVRACWMDDG